MPSFQINQDLTYEASPIVKKNVFLSMPAEDKPLPKYEKIAHLLPVPVWRDRDDVIACYDFAWRRANACLRFHTHHSRA